MPEILNKKEQERLRDQLIRHEGVRLKPYRCSAGKLTIGVGRNLDDVGISPDEALMLLRNDIGHVEHEVGSGELGYLMPSLNAPRRAVLLNMAFNLGMPRLLKFTRFIAALERGDYKSAAAEMLDSRWASQVGKRADELAAQMQTGQWMGDWYV